MLPTLRLGYLVVPLELVDKFAAARFMTDRHSSVLDQAVMCDFLTGGHFARHIRRMREIHAARLDALSAAIKGKLAGSAVLPTTTAAGISVIVWLQQHLKARSVVDAALANGVDVVALSEFVLNTPRPEGLVLGFAPYDVRQIDDGMTRLARAIDKCANGGRKATSRRLLANR